MIQAYPLKFKSILKTPIWGSERWVVSAVPGSESVVCNGLYNHIPLCALINRFGRDILGDFAFNKWGGRFPLLVKFIDAKEDLSIQVHPNDMIAQERHNCLGKNEMWYVLNARKDAKLMSGFKKTISKSEYLDLVADNNIVTALNVCSVTSGDVFYIPAGRIHAICGGCFLLEIQENSDITYRIYDYGRLGMDGKKRELHTRLAKDAIDYSLVRYPKGKFVSPGFRDSSSAIVHSPEFCVDKVEVSNNEGNIIDLRDSFSILVCTKGSTAIAYCQDSLESVMQLREYETVLVPAALKTVSLKGDGEVIRAWIADNCRDL
jgi:mannose-6-phosphate isomerase